MNLNQITIPSLDVKASVEFYRRLGLKQIVDNLPRYARLECPDGNSTFSIHLIDKLPQGHGVIIYFECDNLDQTVQELKRNGIQFSAGPQDQPWLWREAHLKDPDGNMICLYYAGKNRLNPPWRIPD